jgi:hypothetical protein
MLIPSLSKESQYVAVIGVVIGKVISDTLALNRLRVTGL